MIVPINKPLNCQRMVSSGEFQTEHWHNEELVWLIKYLREKKWPNEKIYQKWKYFRAKDKPDYDENLFKENFKSYFNNSFNAVFKKKYSTIIVYQDEIDYINSIPAPLWVRQYIYILTIHSRASGYDTYDHLPFDEYHWFLSIVNNNTSILKSRLIARLRELEILKIVGIKEMYESLPIIDDNGFIVGYENEATIINERLTVKLPVKIKSNKRFKYVTILDALKDIGKIHSIYKCPICGKEYEFTKRMQRDICINCYTKKRNKQKHYARANKLK